MADICKLQVCKTVEIFELGVELFLAKWRACKDDGVAYFIANNNQRYI